MHKLILMNVEKKYLLNQPEYPMLQSRVSEGLFKPHLGANCFTGEQEALTGVF